MKLLKNVFLVFIVLVCTSAITKIYANCCMQSGAMAINCTSPSNCDGCPYEVRLCANGAALIDPATGKTPAMPAGFQPPAAWVTQCQQGGSSSCGAKDYWMGGLLAMQCPNPKCYAGGHAVSQHTCTSANNGTAITTPSTTCK